MPGTVFEIIREDFVAELGALRELVQTLDGTGRSPRTRLAAANSATLLLAATFEEFVREMAREHARAVVARVSSFDRLPRKLVSTAWKRSMESLARVRFDVDPSAREGLMVDTHTRFSVVYEFVKGDLTKDIYRDLIHNENNLRPNELNAMFSVAGLSDVCSKICEEPAVLTFFGESEAGKAHGKLLATLEEFFERRNGIAHALNPLQSNGPGQIFNDIDLLLCLSEAMYLTLDGLFERLPGVADAPRLDIAGAAPTSPQGTPATAPESGPG